jgi:hypothetical protein
MFNCPILIIAFNRPDHASKILDAVRLIQPSHLYIAIDGPRHGNVADAQAVEQTKRVFEGVEWPCTITRLYRESNLGCKHAVSGAITWFFEHVESGIILEDDCLPVIDFFHFCEDMLSRYKDEASVMHINGVNYQNGNHRGDADYYFSKVCHVWGWASWSRAWKRYDIELNHIDTFFDDNLYKSVINYPSAKPFWKGSFTNTRNGLVDTWDYQWVFTIWKNNGLVIAPNFNLISNIGFDGLATHTKFFDKKVSARKLEAMPKKRTYMDILVANYEADQYSFNTMFKYKNVLQRQFFRIEMKLKSLLTKA